MASKYQNAINSIDSKLEAKKNKILEQEKYRKSSYASAYKKMGLLEEDTISRDESRRVNQIASDPSSEIKTRNEFRRRAEAAQNIPLSVGFKDYAARSDKFSQTDKEPSSETAMPQPVNKIPDISTRINVLDRKNPFLRENNTYIPEGKDVSVILPSQNKPENKEKTESGGGFTDRLVNDAKYIGEMGKLGLESGVDALKTTGKTFASSIMEFLERLFPGKEVGDSGIKLPSFRKSTAPVMRSYNESKDAGLQDVSTPVKAAASSFNDELARNLDEYANTNTRQAKLEALQEEYSDQEIGAVTQFLAEGANSIGYNLPAQAANLFTGGLGGALVMGTQAFGDSFADARRGGASRQQAIEYASKEAINQGALDSLFGLIGGSMVGGKLSSVGTKFKSPAVRTAFDVVTNAFGEGAEEMLQSIVTTLNEKTTYNKDAEVDPKTLAYEGLLGGTMGLFFGSMAAPGKYKSYRSDYDLVNEYSKRAAKVSDETEADSAVRVGEYLIQASDNIINNKSSSDEDIARAKYIKKGISESLNILSGYKNRIIVDNTEKAEIVNDIINQPRSLINKNLARLVERVSESSDPDENAVNKTIDYIRDEIRLRNAALRNLPASGAAATELERRALIEIEKTLRENRNAIEAERSAMRTTIGIASDNDPEPVVAASVTSDGISEPAVLTEEQKPDMIVNESEATSLPAKKEFTLSHKQTKHTKTGETLDVFATSGKLSKEEYASLKQKMKEVGGYWSGFVKGFIVPSDKVDAVSAFADVLGDNKAVTVTGESDLVKGDNIPDSNIKKTTSIADDVEASPTRTAAGNDVNTLSEEYQTPAPVSGRFEESSIADDTNVSPRVTSTSQSDAPGDDFGFSDSIVTQTSNNVNNDTTDRSDKHQAMAEGVIPTIAPQATTSVVDEPGVQTETVSADSLVNSFYSEIADRIATDYLDTGKALSINDLQSIATSIYKGTLAEGAFSVKDMTDALELAVNRHIIKKMSENSAQYNIGSSASAEKGLQWAEWLLERIPTQTKRTDEQISLQQFSTPPNIAYLANWIANIDNTDFMLEPSAGIGGLASFAKGFGATTAVNEISERRLGALRSLGFDHVFSEDAAQLDNILPDFVKPTVVVMNPPFSSTGGRTKNSTANAKPHIEQALNRLENGGRLVAILGQGMSNDAHMFSGWWDQLRKDYNIRANIGIDGSNYRKYGTTFNVRLVVIDKTGPQNGETITGDFKSLNDIPKIMEGVRNDRTHTGTTESNTAVAGNEEAPLGTRSVSEIGRAVSDTVSSDNAADVASGNAVERRISADSGRSVRSESSSDKRARTDAGTTVPGDNEQRPGGRSVSSESDESVTDMAQNKSGGRTGRSDVGGRGTSDNDLSVDSRQSGNAEVDGGRNSEITESQRKATPKAQKKKANTSDDGIYAGYVPSKLAIKGAKSHPAVLVAASAMAAVASPEITYTPKISQDVIDKGLISDVQLENISYAGQAHEQMLDNGSRKGYFIGDGTGVGKGRQAAGIILDNFNQGRRKALWISEKAPLMEDAKRDWGDIGGNPDEIFDIDGIRKGVGKGKSKKVPDEGILFVPYSTVKSGKSADKKTTNADTIIQWLGKDFDGVIIYDEAHNMNSLIPSSGSRGMKKAAQQAIEANKIQEALPNARVVYMSATGATEVKDLCFASRLGLWGKGTQFMNAEDFSSKIGASGVAGMELVASSLKSMGVYQARSISFEGVRYDSVRHKLTKQQRQMYDTMSEAWQITLQNMEKAIKMTGVKNAGTARSIFYSTMQNFYNQVLSSMATPSVIDDIKKELDAGHSCVIQLINTNESQQEKELSKAKAEERDLEDLDITPRGALLGFLENSFPVQQYEKYLDEHGNENSRPVYDSKGAPVLNKQAVAVRDALISRINEMSIPDGPIDMILNAFGADKVAEVTGRSRRVVNKPDENGIMRKVEETLKSDFRVSETTAFQNGEKRILIFSNAGSTGRSYHADKRAKNQQQRIHYILQPGWNAKTATQGFGRTHRSNQVQPPVYKLVQTDIEGQKRFVTSIARRLDQLGALTKGQRQTGSGIFGEKDNLESPLSRDALREFFKRLGKEQVTGVNGKDVFTKLGLYRNFYDEYGNFTLKSDKADDITTFLNRLLALKVDEQNIVFGEFESIRQQMYDTAIENGTLDTGISNVKADKITVNQEETIYTDEKTGAETKYVKATAFRKTTPIKTLDDAMSMRGQFQGLYRMQDGSVRAVYRIADETDAFGRVTKKYLLQSPNRSVQSRFNESNLISRASKIPEKEWEAAWSEELKNVPEFNENTLHIITGAILPVWNKLPQDGNIKAMKIVTDDGNQILGRIIPPDRIDSVLRGMDIKQKNEAMTGKQIYDAIITAGKEAVFSPSYSGRNTIKRSRVSGENRLEITGNNIWSLQSDYPDIISETIQYQRRYFIPTGEKGIKILEDLVSKYDITVSSKNESSVFYSNMEGKWGKGDNSGKTLKSVSDLQKEATRIFGVQINTGKVGKSGASGVYKTHANTIRTRTYGDLPAIAHELGHWFDRRYHIADNDKMVSKLVEVYREDLDNAGYHESVYPNEAIAMYFSDLLRNRQEAKSKNPEFSDWLDNTLSSADKKRLSEYTDMTNTYHAADEIRRRNAQIHFRHKDHSVSGEAQLQVDTFLRNPVSYIGNLSRRFVRAWVDDMVDLKSFGNTYNLSMKERTANSITHGRLSIAFTDNAGNIIGRSLSDILQEGGINDLNHRDFNAYLVARCALDRIEAAENGENIGTLVYADKELQNKENIISDILSYERDNPTFADAASGVYEYRNNLLDIASDSGIISEYLAEYFKETFPHYVPLYRVMDDKSSVSSGRGKKTPKAPIGRFKGSGRDIYAPIENLALQTSQFTKAILQNDVRREFADFIDTHEDMGWAAEQVPESKVFDVVSTDEIGYRLSKFDSDKITSLDADQKAELFEEVMSFIGDTTGMWKAKTKQDDNVISVLRDGRRVYYEIHDKDLMNAMLTMNPKEYGVIISAIGNATKWFKVLTTGSNPRFGMTNIPRDIQSGFISSKTTNNPIRYGVDFVRALGESVAETEGYKDYLRNGGGYQGALSMDMRNLKHEYQNLVKSKSSMKNFIRNAVGVIPRLIDAGESASRYAEYNRARQKGIDALEALRKSQEITVNFQRHGKLSGEIDKIIPYFNASIQSMYHLYDTLFEGSTKEKTGAWSKFIGSNVILASMILVWNNVIAPHLFDEEDEPRDAYANLSTYNKNAYWCFYIGDGEFLRIAKPKDMMVPSTVISNLFELQVNENPDSFYGYAGYLADTFFPPAASDATIIGTALSLAKNETFTGAPIVSSAYQNLAPELQYNEKTSGIGVLLGSALGLSPMQIDYVIDDTTGFVGDFILNLTKQGGTDIKSLMDLDENGIPNVLTADSVYSTDVISIMYDTKGKYDTEKASYNATGGTNNKYTAYSVYGSYKYGKISDLYSDVNKKIKADTNTVSSRNTRSVLNSLIQSVNHNEVTDIDKAVSALSEKTGASVSDMAPYIVVPESIKDANKNSFSMDAVDMMNYYTESQILFEVWYPKILESGYSDNDIVDALTAMKKEIKKQMDSRYLEILKNP